MTGTTKLPTVGRDKTKLRNELFKLIDHPKLALNTLL